MPYLTYAATAGHAFAGLVERRARLRLLPAGERPATPSLELLAAFAHGTTAGLRGVLAGGFYAGAIVANVALLPAQALVGNASYCAPRPAPPSPARRRADIETVAPPGDKGPGKRAPRPAAWRLWSQPPPQCLVDPARRRLVFADRGLLLPALAGAAQIVDRLGPLVGVKVGRACSLLAPPVWRGIHRVLWARGARRAAARQQLGAAVGACADRGRRLGARMAGTASRFVGATAPQAVLALRDAMVFSVFAVGAAVALAALPLAVGIALATGGGHVMQAAALEAGANQQVRRWGQRPA